MQYLIQQISKIVKGRFFTSPVTDANIEHILLDSRQVTFPSSSLFIALPGRHRDGHEFLEELQAAGVKNFLLSRPPSPELQRSGVNYLVVEDTLRALQTLASHHRRQFDIPVIGITGSNGKTIVKEWLFQLLREDYRIVRSPRSYNSQIGVPLSVLQMKPEHQLAIFEAGISQMGEMENLAEIICPTLGVFTNLGEAHSEGFKSISDKGLEKGKLFDQSETVICQHSAIRNWRSTFQKKNDSPKIFSWEWGTSLANISVSLHQNKNLIEFREAGKDSFLLSLSELKYPENAIACWTVMRQLGYSPSLIAERMKKLEPVAMRLELKEGLNGCTIVNDSYNSDLTSLRIALEFLRQQSQPTKRTVILSDILQSGKTTGELYGQVAKLLLENKVDRLLGIGEEVFKLKNLLPKQIEKSFYKTTSAFLKSYPDLVFQNETILLKGARVFGFEKIADRLASKVHQTVLEVNLTALLNNLRTYQSYLLPGTKLMVMVKAGAYGSGSAQVAKLLEFQQVDYLAVAYADEGVELRNAGIQLPIMVLNPEEATFDSLLRFDLEPEIYSLELLKKLKSYISKTFHQEQEDSDKSAILIHLKLDTGMHRLGFDETSLEGCLKELLSCSGQGPKLRVKSVFSHLAASENEAHDGFSKTQIKRFEKMYQSLTKALNYQPLRHILNSSGIIRFPEHQMDMVRLGIGLYGVDGSGLLEGKLQIVNTLRATISQIKKVKKGETVGYGRSGKVKSDMRIATISIGYADGLLRRAGNKNYEVLIRGQKSPIFGNVCMDMTMVDISHIPDAIPGDEVTIFGVDSTGINHPVEELAACLDTIPYEVFTSISGRVKRIYVQE